MKAGQRRVECCVPCRHKLLLIIHQNMENKAKIELLQTQTFTKYEINEEYFIPFALFKKKNPFIG